MGKASLTIAIGGEYQGSSAIKRAEAELKQLRQAAREAGGGASDIMKLGDSMVDLGSNMQKTGADIEAMGTRITKLTAPIAAVGAACVKLASDYEDSLAKVYTIMDKTAVSTEDMSQGILDLSTATGKSATELADAAYQALSASVDTEKVVGFVEQAAKLSKAGFTATATAVDTLTTVINAYGMSADDAEAISNRLVQTQNKGKTTVDELASSMGQVIPTAAAYNVNLDNLCSSYVILTKQGINTANATTMLNGMMTELAKEGSTVADILQKETGKTFGQLMNEGMDLGQVIQILSDSVDGNSEAFANLWGNVRASKGALAIANAGADEFTDAMGSMNDSLGLVDAALEDLATPAAKARKAINAVTNTGIQLGEEIIGAAVPSLEKLGQMAQDLYSWFKDLDKGTKQSIVRFGALAVAVGPAVTVFGKLYGSVGSLITAMGRGLQSVGTFAAAMKAAETATGTAGTAATTFGSKVKAAATQTGVLTRATNLLKGSLAMLGIAAAVALVTTLVDKFRQWKEHTETVERATSGLTGALSNASKAYNDAVPSINAATGAMEAQTASVDDAIKSQADLADAMAKTWKDVGTKTGLLDRYAKTIEKLGEKGDLTAEELVQLKVAVDGYNEITGESVTITDEQTGALDRSKEAILERAEAYKEEARQAAAQEMLIELSKQRYTNELALKKAKDELARAEAEYQKALREYPSQAEAYERAMNRAKANVDEMEEAVRSAEQAEKDLTSVVANGATTIEKSTPKVEEAAKSLVGTISENVKPLSGEMAGYGAEAGASYASGISSNMSAAGNAGVAVAVSARDAAGSVSAWGTGYNFSAGFADGAKSYNVWDAIVGVAGSAIAAARWALDIGSPSKKAAEIGSYFGEGLVLGMQSQESAIADESTALGDLMNPTPYGYGAYGSQYYNPARRGSTTPGGAVTMNVTINVGGGDAANAQALGVGIADTLYREIKRRGGASLWDASLSVA